MLFVLSVSSRSSQRQLVGSSLLPAWQIRKNEETGQKIWPAAIGPCLSFSTVSPLALEAGEMALRSGPSGRIRPNLLALMGCALLTSIGSAFYYFSSRLDRLAQVLVQGGSCARC